MLGKRKRETVILRHTPKDTEEAAATKCTEDGADDVFRKYFEAKFDPLPEPSLTKSHLQNDKDDNEDSRYTKQDDVDTSDSEWSGISEATDTVPVVEVVDHAGTIDIDENNDIDRIFQRSFMSSKPPREMQDTQQNVLSDKLKTKNEDEVEENTNLKHDLDLQRLLLESHLLEQTKQRRNGGAQRHKATDLRLRSLGSKASLFAQEKMPMSHRKGILAKVSSKDAHRRREARENGIVLEKSSKKSFAGGPRRDRGVDMPVVGKFKGGGTLQLSRKDVASIQGPRRAGSKKGRR